MIPATNLTFKENSTHFEVQTCLKTAICIIGIALATWGSLNHASYHGIVSMAIGSTMALSIPLSYVKAKASNFKEISKKTLAPPYLTPRKYYPHDFMSFGLPKPTILHRAVAFEIRVFIYRKPIPQSLIKLPELVATISIDKAKSNDDIIPEELELLSFSFLDVEDLARSRRVSKKWQQLASQDEFWEIFAKKALIEGITPGRIFKQVTDHYDIMSKKIEFIFTKRLDEKLPCPSRVYSKLLQQVSVHKDKLAPHLGLFTCRYLIDCVQILLTSLLVDQEDVMNISFAGTVAFGDTPTKIAKRILELHLEHGGVTDMGFNLAVKKAAENACTAGDFIEHLLKFPFLLLPDIRAIAIIAAAKRGDTKVVKMLQPQFLSELNRQVAVWHAIDNNHPKLACLLLQSGNLEEYGRIFVFIIRKGDWLEVLNLINLNLLSAADKAYALYFAVKLNHQKILHYLLTNINFTEKELSDALNRIIWEARIDEGNFAVSHEHMEILEIFKKYNAIPKSFIKRLLYRFTIEDFKKGIETLDYSLFSYKEMYDFICEQTYDCFTDIIRTAKFFWDYMPEEMRIGVACHALMVSQSYGLEFINEDFFSDVLQGKVVLAFLREMNSINEIDGLGRYNLYFNLRRVLFKPLREDDRLEALLLIKGMKNKLGGRYSEFRDLFSKWNDCVIL